MRKACFSLPHCSCYTMHGFLYDRVCCINEITNFHRSACEGWEAHLGAEAVAAVQSGKLQGSVECISGGTDAGCESPSGLLPPQLQEVSYVVWPYLHQALPMCRHTSLL